MDDWTRDWPTEPDTWHWFYGSDHSMRKGYRRLYAVHVEQEVVRNPTKPDGARLVYRYLGGKLSPANGATGVWLPMQVPEIPGARS